MIVIAAALVFVGFIAGTVTLAHSIMRAEAILEAWDRARWRNISVEWAWAPVEGGHVNVLPDLRRCSCRFLYDEEEEYNGFERALDCPLHGEAGSLTT